VLAAHRQGSLEAAEARVRELEASLQVDHPANSPPDGCVIRMMTASLTGKCPVETAETAETVCCVGLIKLMSMCTYTSSSQYA